MPILRYHKFKPDLDHQGGQSHRSPRFLGSTRSRGTFNTLLLTLRSLIGPMSSRVVSHADFNAKDLTD